MPTSNLDAEMSEYDEARRVANICNACRYCEGFCDVFPTMERLIDFDKSEIKFLANVCHDCRECYHACQFAPPHEYAVNIPSVMSKVRVSAYAASDDRLGQLIKLFSKTIVCTMIYPLIFILLGYLSQKDLFWESYDLASGNFYQLMPHENMVVIFGTLGIAVLLIVAARTKSFHNEINKKKIISTSADIYQSLKDAVSLKNLKSSGQGCTYPKSKQSRIRSNAHHMMAWGFMLCFASTSIGTIYHYFLNLEAPYMYTTLPVILGSSGGVLLLLGCSILLILKLYQDRAPTDSNHDRSSIKFLLLLFLIAFTGLALLILRETVWMGFLLYWHLGLVFSFFLVIPYEKMMHVLFRVVALINAKKVTNES